MKTTVVTSIQNVVTVTMARLTQECLNSSMRSTYFRLP
jgi:hypothetical protein